LIDISGQLMPFVKFKETYNVIKLTSLVTKVQLQQLSFT
jgi:hypothetical protein